MLKLVNLIKNENMKLTRKISTWIMLGILISLVIFIGGLGKYQESKYTAQDWKKSATAQMNAAKAVLDKGSGAPAELKYYEKTYEINHYRLEHNIPPLDEFSMWSFVEETANLINLVALFAIVLGGGIVANEFGEGTIKLLLIRPAKRWKILLAKYISVAVMSVAMLLVLFVSSILVGGVLFGFDNMNQLYLNFHNGVVEETNMMMHLLSQYGLDSINLVMMVTLAFMISTVFRNSSFAIGAGVFLMFAGNLVVMLLSRYEWCKYILFANVDLTQYITGTPIVKGMTLSFSITVLLIYYLIFQAVAFIGFGKRDVAA